MRRSLSTIGSVDWSNPVNWSHSLNRGLVSWWLAVPNRMGFGSVTWRDLCGRNHGTLTSMDPATDWVGPRGRPGGWGALDFDGSDDHVLCADDPFDLTDMTILAWAQTATVTGIHRIVGKGGCGGAQWQYIFGINGAAVEGATLQAAGSAHLIVSGGTVSIGVPYFSGMTVGGDVLTLYLNGVSVATDVTPSGTRHTSGTCALRIGGRGDGAQDWSGLIGDVRIYNRALSDAEVSEYYDLSLRYCPGLLNRVRRPYYSVAEAGGAESPLTKLMQQGLYVSSGGAAA